MGKTTDYDVVIVGAGISGINAAYRIQTQTPNAKYTILEGRKELGGTWSLFKYNGIRSDSDLHTFGFAFRPWTDPQAIAAGPAILKYIKETAEEYGIDKKIQYSHRLASADWSSASKHWTLSVNVVDEAEKKVLSTKTYTSRFFIAGTGYYNYKEALSVDIPGIKNFGGQVVHPQFWPENFDYTDKRIVIIGSGATAITLLPNLADKAKHVTMLQRSPSYILAIPRLGGRDEAFLKSVLPISWAYTFIRWRAILLGFIFVRFCLLFPNAAKRILKRQAVRQLPSDIPHDPHFEPKYLPWQQRMCIVPEGDFYTVLREKKGGVATGTIKTVEKDGILLDGGQKLDADIIVTATGLKLQLLGGAKLSFDGKPIDISSKFVWNGVMLEDVPNAVLILGYTNASWTLGSDATAQLTTRLINMMDSKGVQAVVPRLPQAEKDELNPRSPLDLSSTYVQKAQHELPRAGDKGPWKPRTSYYKDMWKARFGDLSEGLEFL